jgi:uncharacterized membrane protein
MMIVLRFAHICSGVLWVGMMAFATFFLMPAIAEVGPDGAKVMAAMQRRRLPVIMPVMAFITLVSGFWLFARISDGEYLLLMMTPMGLTYAVGGGSAVLALLIGIVAGRQAMMRGATLTESLATAAPEQRAGLMGELQRLQRRGTVVNWIVMGLLLFTLALMAVARYFP